MQGKIIKGIAGFYYVQTEDKLYECKAKGIFRNKKMKPLVGDNVEIDILDETEQEGNITKIYERHNELIRPAVSNVDQALIIFAAKNPKPNYNLLDRFLMMMEKQDVPVIVCFNKVDLAKEKELKFEEYYGSITEKFISSLQIYLAAIMNRYQDTSEIGDNLRSVSNMKDVKLKFILVVKNAEDITWLAGPLAELRARLLKVRKIWGVEVVVLNEELAGEYNLTC